MAGSSLLSEWNRRAWTLLLILWLGAAAVRGESAQSGALPERIVSMAPSTTEILFALGAGDRVVGVTRYCDYPASVTQVAKVGGYVDPSYETIVALEPDLVILLDSHGAQRKELEKMGIATLSVPHETLEDIHESLRRIGAACGREREAAELLDDIAGRSRALEDRLAGRERPSVLLCIGRDTESGQLAGMYVAGRHGYYDEIIRRAGGRNAYRDEAVAYPQVSAEGVIQLRPEVIVDLVNFETPAPETIEQIRGQWRQLRAVPAVREDRVHVVVGSHALRPGPRYIDFLEEMARLLHPEAFAGDGDDD